MQIGDLVLGRFRIEAPVASGGMGTVYRALDLSVSRVVALKTCLASAAPARDQDPATRQARAQARFELEACALSEIADPAVVGYVAHGTSDAGEPFLVMDWVEGESLAQRLGESGLSVEQALLLGRDLTRALSVIHSAGIVHRDLKPQNVMLRGGDVRRAVLVDFGVARRAEGVSVTLSGARVGTLLYMAPEQIRDPRSVDGRADVFALGCMLFECLTGQPAFEADDALATIARILLDDVPEPRRLRPELPEAAARLVKSMLARERTARPTADCSLERELEALAEQARELELGAPGHYEPRSVPQPEATRDIESADDRPLSLRRPAELPSPQSVGQRRASRGPENRFVAREAELAHLQALVQSGTNLLVLWGAPGIGKTRLAHELMRPSGAGKLRQVELVDLGQARDRDDALRVLIGRFDAGLRPGEHVEQVIGRALGRLGPGLFILDRVEHLASKLEPLLEQWRRAAPGSCFLLTSRERLQLPGAIAIELGPLTTANPSERRSSEQSSLSEAATLFVERMRESDARIELGPAQYRVIETAVQALDGIPLAIELAAARVKLLGLEGVAARLGRQGETAMRGAIDASLELLSPAERRAFEQCAAFKGAFTLSAAEAVLELGAEAAPVVDVLQSLRDKSLLSSLVEVSGSEPRLCSFSVVRQHAAQELARSGQEATVLARHAAYFMNRARELSSSSGAAKQSWEATQQLEVDSEDLLAAIDHALADGLGDVPLALEALSALEPVITARGPLPAFLRLIERAVEGAERLPAAQDLRGLDRVRLLRARIAAPSGRFDVAFADLETVIQHALAQADTELEAAAQLELGVAHHLRRSLESAQACYERSLVLLQQQALPELEGRCIGNLGALLHDAGRLTEAAAYYWRAVRKLEEHGELRMRANFLNNLGVLEQELGAFARARRHYREALELLSPVADDRVCAITLGNLGVLEQECGAWERARRCHEQALELFSPLADAYSEALCLARLGATLATLGDATRAEAHLTRAVRLMQSGEASQLEAVRLQRAFLDLALAQKELALGDADGARLRLEQAGERCRRVEGPDAGGPALASRSDDIRVTLRILKPMLARLEP